MSQSDQPPRRRIPARLIVSLVVLIAAVAAIAYLTRPKPVSVSVAEIGRGIVQYTVANTRAGTVDACRRARISPAAGGQVALMRVHEGDRVEAGQVLLTLWNEDVAAQLQLAEQEAVAAEAKVDDACVRAEAAQREADRLRQLYDRGLASDDRRDQAVSEAKARAAACRAAEASLLVSRAKINSARATLDKTILTAPFAGIVAEVNPEVGEYVTPSPPGIATPPAVDLIDDSCVYVTAPIDEVDAAAIRPGMRAMITLDAIRDRQFAGTVRRVAPYVLDLQKQARTVDVEAVFDNPKEVENLLAGYSADVEIILEERKDVLRLPTEAVLSNDRVLVFEQGRLAERTFQPGLSNWRYTEVVSGLHEGELLVTSLEREGVEAGAQARRDDQ